MPENISHPWTEVLLGRFHTNTFLSYLVHVTRFQRAIGIDGLGSSCKSCKRSVPLLPVSFLVTGTTFFQFKERKVAISQNRLKTPPAGK